MKQRFSEKSKREKIEFVIIQTMRVITVLVMAYVIFLRVKTGQHVSPPLILLPLLFLISLSNISNIRKRFQGTEEGRAQFRKIFVRSVILGLIITIVFLTVTVFIIMSI